MPIRHTSEGWWWGSKGPFSTKKKALQVQGAAYASGYKKSLDGKKKKVNKGIGEGIYGRDLNPEHLNRMFPRDKETIRPIDKAAMDYANVGQYRDKPFTETTYDVYNYNSPDSDRDLNKQKEMKKMADNKYSTFDPYEHHSLDPTIDELRTRFGDKLTPDQMSGIEKILRERDEPMGDIRKTLDRIDSIIEKSNQWHESAMERKLLAIDAFIAKSNPGQLIDDFDLVKSGVGRPMLLMFQKNGRPDKEWWNNCTGRAGSFADDPASYCGKLWVGKSMDIKKDHTADDTLDIIHTVVDVLDKDRHEPGEIMEDNGHNEAMPMGSTVVNDEMNDHEDIFADEEDEDLEKAGQDWSKDRFAQQKRAFGKNE